MATTETKLVVALGVLAVLGGGLYMTNKKQSEEAKAYSLDARAADLPKIELSDDDVAKITKLTLHRPGKEGAAAVDVTLTKKGEEWRVTEPVDAEAMQAHVKSLLDNLKSVKVSEVIDTGKTEYAKYKVSDELGFHVQAFKDDKAVFDVYFGDNGGRGQMTRIAGKDGVYAVKGYSDYLYNRDVKSWRDMQLLKFEEVDVESVNVDNEHGSFSFTKKDGNWVGKYKPTKGVASEIKRFDGSKVLDLIRAYRALSADNYAEKGKTVADVRLDKPVSTVVFTLKDGAKREVKVGNTAEGTSRWVQVTGKDEIFSISSWAADWAMAEEKKFQKEDAKKDDKPAPPADAPSMPNPHGM